MQGGAQNLERIPPPKGAPPGLPKFRASGQTIDTKDEVRLILSSARRDACGAAKRCGDDKGMQLAWGLHPKSTVQTHIPQLVWGGNRATPIKLAYLQGKENNYGQDLGSADPDPDCSV